MFATCSLMFDVVIEMLLESGADISKLDSDKNTALLCACMKVHLHIHLLCSLFYSIHGLAQDTTTSNILISRI